MHQSGISHMYTTACDPLTGLQLIHTYLGPSHPWSWPRSAGHVIILVSMDLYCYVRIVTIILALVLSMYGF